MEEETVFIDDHFNGFNILTDYFLDKSCLSIEDNQLYDDIELAAGTIKRACIINQADCVNTKDDFSVIFKAKNSWYRITFYNDNENTYSYKIDRLGMNILVS